MFTRILMSLALVASLASAENLKQAVHGYLNAVESTQPWIVTGIFGLSLTDGNSDTLSVTTGIDASKKWDPWTLVLQAKSLYAENAGVESASEHIFSEKLSRALSEKASLWQMFVLENDSQEDLSFRILFTVGYERQLVKKEGYSLAVDVGGGVLHEEYHATNSTEGIAQIGFTVVWQITKNLKYEGRFVFWPSLSEGGEFRAMFLNTFTMPVNDRIDMRLEINDKYNSDPQGGNQENDLHVLLALTVKFTQDQK
jgi:putative salt-induced outer membrane protein YdiY